MPTIFAKFATAVIGPGEAIVLPKISAKPDYEAELAFVIGKGGRYIPKDRWQEHVFGYTNLNDVSARDYQMATTQWMMGKTFDTFAPFGPAIVTADEIADPHALDIQMIINGEVLQNSNTSQLIFRIPELIEYFRACARWKPGDIVSTGTPSGVGFSRNASALAAVGRRMRGEDYGAGRAAKPGEGRVAISGRLVNRGRASSAQTGPTGTLARSPVGSTASARLRQPCRRLRLRPWSQSSKSRRPLALSGTATASKSVRSTGRTN